MSWTILISGQHPETWSSCQDFYIGSFFQGNEKNTKYLEGIFPKNTVSFFFPFLVCCIAVWERKADYALKTSCLKAVKNTCFIPSWCADGTCTSPHSLQTWSQEIEGVKRGVTWDSLKYVKLERFRGDYRSHFCYWLTPSAAYCARSLHRPLRLH